MKFGSAHYPAGTLHLAPHYASLESFSIHLRLGLWRPDSWSGLGLGVKYIDLRDRNVAASSLGTQSARTQPSLKHNTPSKKTAAQQGETSEMKEITAEHRERVSIKPIPGADAGANT